MTPERKTYLRDNGDNDVSGAVVIESDENEVRVTENRKNGWCKPFWMPESELDSHDLELTGTLDSGQFLQIFERVK
jgi:hypothetical protein